jgi:hypothetical protein
MKDASGPYALDLFVSVFSIFDIGGSIFRDQNPISMGLEYDMNRLNKDLIQLHEDYCIANEKIIKEFQRKIKEEP